jgi:hypothetical protein
MNYTKVHVVKTPKGDYGFKSPIDAGLFADFVGKDASIKTMTVMQSGYWDGLSAAFKDYNKETTNE